MRYQFQLKQSRRTLKKRMMGRDYKEGVVNVKRCLLVARESKLPSAMQNRHWLRSTLMSTHKCLKERGLREVTNINSLSL